MQIINMDPMGKPRMTRKDQFQTRPVVARYRAYADQLRHVGLVDYPESDSHLVAVLPMPKSWSNKKRSEMFAQPHQQTPDKDNIEKAVLDAVFSKKNTKNGNSDDSHIWHGMVSKFWGVSGMLILGELETEIPARAEDLKQFIRKLLEDVQGVEA